MQAAQILFVASSQADSLRVFCKNHKSDVLSATGGRAVADIYAHAALKLIAWCL
jgi:hypothetical protein